MENEITYAEALTRLDMAQRALRAFIEAPFHVHELGYGSDERAKVEAYELGRLKKALGVTDLFCIGCGHWHKPGDKCGCFDEQGELIPVPMDVVRKIEP